MAEDNYSSIKYTVASDTEEFLKKFERRTEEGFELIDFEQADDVWLGIYEQPDSAMSEIYETQYNLAVIVGFTNSIHSLISI